MPPKRKASQRRSSSPTTLESIVKSNPAAWETLKAARKESNEAFRPSKARSASSSSKQESGPASTASGSKPTKRRKLASDEEEYVEEGNEGSEGELESSKKPSKKREAGKPGRPAATSKPVKALVVLTHGTTDHNKTMKGFPRPPWDLIVASSMSGLSFIASTEDEIVIERTWSDDEGYQYVISAFPSLINAIKTKLHQSSKDQRCLRPLFYYNKALQVGQGFDGETIFKRLDPKDKWSSRYLFFVTYIRLNESDLSNVSLSKAPSLQAPLHPPLDSATAASSSSSHSPSVPSIAAGPSQHSSSKLAQEPTTDEEVEYVTTKFQSQASVAVEEEQFEEIPPSPPKPKPTDVKGKARQVPPRPVPQFVDPLAAFALDVPNPYLT